MRYLLGVVSGVILVFLAGYFFVISGLMPVATKGAPLPGEEFLADAAIHAAVKGSVNAQASFSPTEEHLMNGAKTYANSCAGCHGLVGETQSAFQRALYPHPPLLLTSSDGVTGYPVGATYWVVKNGIRLTGMPAFAEMLSDTQIWEVSQLLKNADHLSKPVQQQLMPQPQK